MTKLEVAAVQLDTAIEMLFEQKHPVPIHTVASAGFRIVRDLAKIKETPRYQELLIWIKPERHKDFWKLLNVPANFFKHADKDPDDSYALRDEKINDLTIFFAITFYWELKGPISETMRMFLSWFMVTKPDFMHESAIRDLILKTPVGLKIHEMDRKSQLEIGLELLRRRKQS